MVNVLRVNYRKTGGVAGTTQLGQGVAQAIGGSTASAAGVNAGGLIYLTSLAASSYTGSLCVMSAYGLMSAFFGSGIYGSGYAVQPLVITPLAFSTINAGDSIVLAAISLRTSGSLAIFVPFASGVTVSGGQTCTIQFLGLVISGP